MGIIYALLAAGFSLIFGVGRILFLAHGQIFMIGAVLTYVFIVDMNLPSGTVFILVPLLLGSFGVVLEKSLFRPMRKRGADDLSIAMLSLVLALVIGAVVLLLFGGRSRGIPPFFPGRVEFLGVSLGMDRIAISLISVAVLVGVQLFLRKGKTGRAIRAVAEDSEAAALVGVNLDRINAVLFFLALGLAGFSGVLMAPFQMINAFIGVHILLITLIVVILGGLGSFAGAIWAGLILGFVHSFGFIFVGSVTPLLGLLAVISILILKPNGILGQGQGQ